MQHDAAIAELIADIPVHIGFYPDNHIILLCHDGTHTLGALPVHIPDIIDADNQEALKEKICEWYLCFNASVNNRDDVHPRWSVVAVTQLNNPTAYTDLDQALTLLNQWLPEVPSPGHPLLYAPSITDNTSVYIYTPHQRSIQRDALAVLPAISSRSAFKNLLDNTSMLPFFNQQELHEWCTSQKHNFDEKTRALLEYNLVTMATLRSCGSPSVLADMAASVLGEKKKGVPEALRMTLILAACVDFRTRNALFNHICYTPEEAHTSSTAYARAALHTMHKACQVLPDSLPVLRVHALGVLSVCALACHHHSLAREIITTALEGIPHAQHYIDKDIIPASHTDLDLKWIERIGTAIMYGDYDYTMQSLYSEGVRAKRVLETKDTGN